MLRAFDDRTDAFAPPEPDRGDRGRVVAGTYRVACDRVPIRAEPRVGAALCGFLERGVALDAASRVGDWLEVPSLGRLAARPGAVVARHWRDARAGWCLATHPALGALLVDAGGDDALSARARGWATRGD